MGLPPTTLITMVSKFPDVYSYEYGLSVSKNYNQTSPAPSVESVDAFPTTHCTTGQLTLKNPKLAMSGKQLHLPRLGENTFIINKIAAANTNMLPPSRELRSPWSSINSSFTDHSSSKAASSSVSEIETLLDFDRPHRAVLKCSKYSEIGNPHARKRKKLKTSAKKQGKQRNWSWSKSYNLSHSSSNTKTKHPTNFMDQNSHSLYNSEEQAKIASFLSVKSSILSLAQPLRQLSLADSIIEKLTATGKELDQPKLLRTAKMCMSIPTITMTLPVS